MDNVEITEDRLQQRGWKKVGNTFYRDKNAVTRFDGKFQVWKNGDYHVVKTFNEILFFTEEKSIKKA